MAKPRSTDAFHLCLLAAACLSMQTDIVLAEQTEHRTGEDLISTPAVPHSEDYGHYEEVTVATSSNVPFTPTSDGSELSTIPSDTGDHTDRHQMDEIVSFTSTYFPRSSLPVVPTTVADSVYHTFQNGDSSISPQGGQLWSSALDHVGRGGSETSWRDWGSHVTRAEEPTLASDLTMFSDASQQFPSSLGEETVVGSGDFRSGIQHHSDTSMPQDFHTHAITSSDAVYASGDHLQSFAHLQSSHVDTTSEVFSATTGLAFHDAIYTSLLDRLHQSESSLSANREAGSSEEHSSRIFPTSSSAAETTHMPSKKDRGSSQASTAFLSDSFSPPVSSSPVRQSSRPAVLTSSMPTPHLSVETATFPPTPFITDTGLGLPDRVTSRLPFPTTRTESRSLSSVTVGDLHSLSAGRAGDEETSLAFMVTHSDGGYAPPDSTGLQGTSVEASLPAWHQQSQDWHSFLWSHSFLPSGHWTASSTAQLPPEKSSSYTPSHASSSVGAGLRSVSAEVNQSPSVEFLLTSSVASSAEFPSDVTSAYATATTLSLGRGSHSSSATSMWSDISQTKKAIKSYVASTSDSFVETPPSSPFVPEMPKSDSAPEATSEKELKTHIVPTSTFAASATTTPTATGITEKPQMTTSTSHVTHTAHVTTTPKVPVGKSYCHFLITFDGNCHLVMNSTMRLGEFVSALLTELSRELDVSKERIKPHDLQCSPTRIYVSLENMHCPSTGLRIRQMILSRRLVLPVVFEEHLATYTATNIRQVDLPTSGIGSIDVPPVTIDNVDIIVIIVACSVCAILIVLCAIMGFRECYRRKYAQSFDLLDIPHVNLKMEDFTLTRIPRPKTIYEDNPTVQTLRKSPAGGDHGHANGNGVNVSDVQLRMQPISEGLVIGITGCPSRQNGEATPSLHRRQGSSSSGSVAMGNARSPSTERLLEPEGGQAADGTVNPTFLSDETPVHSANPVC